MTAPNLEPCAWCGENGAWLDKRVCCSSRSCSLHNLTMTPQDWNTRAHPPVPSGLTEEEKERVGQISAHHDETQEFLDRRNKNGPQCHYDREFLLGLVRRLSVAPAKGEREAGAKEAFEMAAKLCRQRPDDKGMELAQQFESLVLVYQTLHPTPSAEKP